MTVERNPTREAGGTAVGVTAKVSFIAVVTALGVATRDYSRRRPRPMSRRRSDMTGAQEKFEQSDQGAAAVEFALVMPLLFLILFGIIDFGRAYNMQLAVTHAAREGVRVAALGNPGAAPGRAQAALFPVTGASAVVSTACPASIPAPPAVAPDAVVTVSRTYNYITPVSEILNLIGQPALATPTITGRGTMRCTG